MTGSKNVITLNLNRIIQDWAKQPAKSLEENNNILDKTVNMPGLTGFKEYLIDILERIYKYQIAYNECLKYLKNNGFGGVLSFFIKGDQKQTATVIDNMKWISHVANVGDAKTLIIHPASTTHEQLPDEAKIAAGVYPNMLRLSLGIEHIDDIKAELDQALSKL